MKYSPLLTVGMATYDDSEGTYWSVQNLQSSHPEVVEKLALVVVDNHPGSPHSEHVRSLLHSKPTQKPGCFTHVDYVELPFPVGTSAPRNKVFETSRAPYTLCMDSHVYFPRLISRPHSPLLRLLNFLSSYEQQYNRQCPHLLSGPLMYDNFESFSTHFNSIWRSGMWGTWDTDQRGLNPDNRPFEIEANGLGMFIAATDLWLGFHPDQKNFGGEEHYIHQKYRHYGRSCLCLPFMRWGHRFFKPPEQNGTPYPQANESRISNYFMGLLELGLELAPCHHHFFEDMTPPDTNPPRS